MLFSFRPEVSGLLEGEIFAKFRVRVVLRTFHWMLYDFLVEFYMNYV